MAVYHGRVYVSSSGGEPSWTDLGYVWDYVLECVLTRLGLFFGIRLLLLYDPHFEIVFWLRLNR